LIEKEYKFRPLLLLELRLALKQEKVGIMKIKVTYIPSNIQSLTIGGYGSKKAKIIFY